MDTLSGGDVLVNEARTDGDLVDDGDDPGGHFVPVPVWLEEPPDATPLLIATRPLVLPFEQLTPENFERLVLKLARNLGVVVHSQLYGVRGQDQHGIDLYCRMRSPGATGRFYRAVQCRNVAEMTATDLATAVEDFLNGRWARRTDTFVFATRVAAVRAERAEAIEAAAARLGEVGIAFEVWDGESLSELLCDLPELVDQFFAREATRLFCGEEAARRLAGRDHARAMLDGMEGRLRERTRGELTASTRGGNAGDVRHLVLDRADIRQRLVDVVGEAAGTAGVVVVHGEPDVGKSALVLDVIASMRTSGVGVIALSLRDVPIGPLASLEQLLDAPIAEVLADLAAAQVRLIVLDGAEVALEGGADLLTDVTHAAVMAGIGVIAVVRNDGRRAVIDALGPAATREAQTRSTTGVLGETESDRATQPIAFDVPALTADEVARVRLTFPEVDRLGEDPRAAWLLGRVGLVDLLLRAGAVVALPHGALSEADVFTAVWSRWVRRGERVDRGGATPDGRDAALTELARRRLFLQGSASVVDSYALPSLRSDGLLLSADEQFAWSTSDEFASDVVRDLATARLLVKEGGTILDPAGAPRWAIRAARIASQAALVDAQRRGGGDVAATREAFRRQQATFDWLASRHGDRWADVPLDAALTAGPAEAIFDACSADLLAGNGHLLARVLRLVTQRYSAMDAAGPVITAAAVAFVLDHVDQINDSDGDVAKRATEVVTIWLRGVAGLEYGGGADPAVARHRPLRRRIRDYLLRHMDYAKPAHLECLALLGDDTDDRVRAVLRDLGVRRPGFLAPCVERFEAIINLAWFDLDLLIELTAAYYIERPDGGRWGLDLFGGGIRHHRTGFGVTIPQAAWYYGPFWQLLCAAPARALAVINQMLNHAAVNRTRQLMGGHDLSTPPASEPPGVTLDVAGLGERRYVGDDHVWAWYRGSTVGPYPCMSALLAVERYVDQALTHGVPVSRLVRALLDDAHNLAMPGLVVGVLVRHLDTVIIEFDEWLAHPAVWELEFFRRAHEGTLHVQGRDPEDIPGRGRRTWTLIDVAGALTFAASANHDQARLGELRAVGDRLVTAAQSIISAEQSRPPDARPASLRLSDGFGGRDDGDAPTPATDTALLSVRRWASMLDANQYQLTEVPEGAAWLWHAPADIDAAMADTERDLARINEADRLLNTYGLRFIPPADEQPAPTPPVSQLGADLAIARDLADDPPAGGSPDTAQIPAAVAAYAVKTVSANVDALPADDLEWAAAAVVAAALHPPVGRWSFDGSLFGSGHDRAAASAVPYLLLPAFTETPPRPATAPQLDEEDLGVVADAITALTTSLYTEVRRITARALGVIWAAPCGPGHAGSATCRHVIAWSAVEAGARHVGLTPWTLTGKREYQELPGPLRPALRDTPARDFMFTRLGPAVIAACDAARSKCCIAAQAIPVREALLDAYTRAAVHWAAEDYPCRPEDRCAVANALLTTAASDPGPLLAVVAGLTGQARALYDMLRALATAATYDETTRASFRSAWPTVMDTVLDAVDAGSTIFQDRSWGDNALAAVVPSPQAALSDSDIVGTMAAARSGWPTPDDLRDRIERWLSHAAGQRHAADNLIGLLQTAPLATQSQLGLPWIRTLILTNGAWSNRSTWHAVDWLRSLRDGNVLDDQTRPAYHELVDALAADDYHTAVALQRDDE